MRKYLIRLLLITICAGYLGCNISKKVLLQKDEGFILIDFSNKKVDQDTVKMAVLVKVDTIQHQTQSCLKFSILMKNKTDTVLKIKNLVDFFDFKLINDSGFNILFPNVSKIYVNSVSAIKNNNQSFKIEKITINGKVADTNIINQEFNSIPSKGQFEIFVSIIKVLKPEATKPYNFSDGAIVIPKGKYLFLLSVPIYSDKSSKLLVLNPGVSICFK
jgi:hypothetical protein